MTISTVLVVAAAVAAVMLVAQTRDRTFPVIALVVAGVQVLLHFGMLHISFRSFPLGLVLGGALAVSGGLSWTSTEGKLTVTAATVVAMTGAVQVLAALF
jgi:hypothetical protein